MTCAVCGAALSPLRGGTMCPACKQQIARIVAKEDLRQAEAFYARIETETYPGADRVRTAVRARIEALKKRMGEEGK